MSGQIFISYRRQESRWSARSLRDRLCREFDPDQIFMDIDTIGLGEDFVETIETTVAKCDVLIAMIGNNWLISKDDHGNRRLDNPEDFVRMEIGAALKRNIRVIPVLVDGALMPQSTDLPQDLKPLVRRNALLITETSFDGDCQRLATTIRQVLEKAAASQQPKATVPASARATAPQPPAPEFSKIMPQFMLGRWLIQGESCFDYFENGTFSGLAIQLSTPAAGLWNLISLDSNKFRLVLRFSSGITWQGDFVVLDRNHIHNIAVNKVAVRIAG